MTVPLFDPDYRLFVTSRAWQVGDGWWFGRNSGGEEGMCPASYLEPLQDSPVHTSSGTPTSCILPCYFNKSMTIAKMNIQRKFLFIITEIFLESSRYF